MKHYVEKLAELVDQLSAYESHTDPLYYTMRFVDGLKHEISYAIMIQRPSDLDAACALTLVQQEALVQHKSAEVCKQDYHHNKLVPKKALPLPVPPT